MTVNHTLVASPLLSPFPVLLDASSLPAEMLTAGGANAAQSDGGDIRFSSDAAGATQLACEVVQWSQNANPALATAEIWVPLDVSSSGDRVFYVWYNAGGGLAQPGVGTTFGARAVWDGNAHGVWHLSTAGFLADSTADNDTLTNNNGVTQVAGKIDGAASFARASSQWLNATDIGVWDGSAQTASCWFKSNTSGILQNLLRRDTGSAPRNWLMRINSSNYLESGLLWGGFSFTTSATQQVTTGSWHMAHLVFSFSGTNTVATLYLDGAAVGSAMTVPGAQPNWNLGLDIGRYQGGGEYIDGQIDEVHMANTARSALWIQTEFNNQDNPGHFTSPGTPVGTTFQAAWAQGANRVIGSGYVS